MPATKATRKAAKKAPKKAAGRHDPHREAKDARRTFEHLGRVQLLSALTVEESESIALLTTTADVAFRRRRYKESADLLRAAEHLSFASLHTAATESVAAGLKQAIENEFQLLIEHSIEHSEKHDVQKVLLPLLGRLTSEAKAAMRLGSYHAALEFARSAEALSHVHGLGEVALPGVAPQKHLKA